MLTKHTYLNTFDKLGEHELYWLGFFFADGCLYRRKGGELVFHLYLKPSEPEKELLEKLLLDLGTNQKIQIRKSSIGISVQNHKFCDTLLKFGIVPRKSFGEWPSSIDEANCRHFIRGLVDGDGYIGWGKRKDRRSFCARFSIVNRENILAKAGDLISAHTGVRYSIRKAGKSKIAKRLTISGNGQVANVVKWLYSNQTIALSRKEQIGKQILTSVEPFDNFRRPQWVDYFMAKAFLAAQRSIDPSTKHGCILVNQFNRVVAEGYNGPPQGANDDLIPLTRPLKYAFMAHAEANALDTCSDSVETAYITGRPCHKCLLRLIQRKVKKVIYGAVGSNCVDNEDVATSRMIMESMKPEHRPELTEYKGLGFMSVLKQSLSYAEEKVF